MKAMIFAAGYGNRLRPLTERLPKALVPVAGRPMIEYPLLLLKHHGIEEIIINLHHLGEQVEQHLKDGRRFGLKIRYSREEKLLDTGGGLLKAKSFFADGTFLVVNCDVITNVPLDDVIAYHREKHAVATLVLRPDPRAEDYGTIECAPDGRIRRFLAFRLPQAGTAALKKRMFTGVQVLEPKVFEYMVPDMAFSITKVTYPSMLLKGEPLYGFDFHGFWQDLGTPERIWDAAEKLSSGTVKLHYL